MYDLICNLIITTFSSWVGISSTTMFWMHVQTIRQINYYSSYSCQAVSNPYNYPNDLIRRQGSNIRPSVRGQPNNCNKTSQKVLHRMGLNKFAGPFGRTTIVLAPYERVRSWTMHGLQPEQFPQSAQIYALVLHSSPLSDSRIPFIRYAQILYRSVPSHRR